MANPIKLLKLKPQGLQFIQEVPIKAPPKKVWATVLGVDKWFQFHRDGDSGITQKNILEARPGGRWYTESDDGSTALHAIITHIEPQKLLRMSGPIGLTHLPVNSVFIFELQPKADGKETLLRFCQRTYGFLTSDVKKKYAGGWKQLFGQLKDVAEGK